MANRSEICCHDSILIGTRLECDRLTCEGKHAPLFNLFHHRVNNGYFYCVNREQLGQYWRCVVEGRDTFCQIDAINARSVKRCQMFLLNCKIVTFFILILIKQIIKNKFHTDLSRAEFSLV